MSGTPDRGERDRADWGAVLLPADAQPARLIVCERSGRWAVALRRQSAAEAVGVYQTRHLAACRAALVEAPASFVVFELTADGIEALLEQMARLARDFPLARAAVVADRSLDGYQWLVRESGAVHFLCSPRQVASLARIASGHLARAPSPPRTLTQQIWARLPWARAGAR